MDLSTNHETSPLSASSAKAITYRYGIQPSWASSCLQFTQTTKASSTSRIRSQSGAQFARLWKIVGASMVAEVRLGYIYLMVLATVERANATLAGQPGSC